MRSFLARRTCVALLTVTALFSAAHAQVPTSTVHGIVTDPKDAVIVGARVTVTSTTQSASRETVTNSSGVYVVPNLTPGSYSVEIQSPGFSASTHKDVLLEAGRSVTIDDKL